MKRSLCVMMLGLILASCEERGDAGKSTTAPAMESSSVTGTDPNDILFTTATLNDAVPAVSSSPAGSDCCRMHEDDWRQFEFVSPAFDAETAAELAFIDEIWKKHSVALGDDASAFREIRVRDLIPRPLDIPMARADFEKLFGARSVPVTFHGYDKTLRAVHAIRLENAIVYAVIDSEKLTTLGIEMSGPFSLTGDVADRVEEFVTAHDLRLVHWRSRTVFNTPQAAMTYLRGTPAKR